MDMTIKELKEPEDIINRIAILSVERMQKGDGLVPRAWLKEVEIMEILHQVEQEWKESK